MHSIYKCKGVENNSAVNLHFAASICSFFPPSLRQSLPYPSSFYLVSSPLFEFISRLGLRTTIHCLYIWLPAIYWNPHPQLNGLAIAKSRLYCLTDRPNCFFNRATSRIKYVSNTCWAIRRNKTLVYEMYIFFIFFCGIGWWKAYWQSVHINQGSPTGWYFGCHAFSRLCLMQSPSDLAALSPHRSAGVLQNQVWPQSRLVVFPYVVASAIMNAPVDQWLDSPYNHVLPAPFCLSVSSL